MVTRSWHTYSQVSPLDYVFYNSNSYVLVVPEYVLTLPGTEKRILFPLYRNIQIGGPARLLCCSKFFCWHAFVSSTKRRYRRMVSRPKGGECYCDETQYHEHG
ncbi:hypothetical protein SERLA73DRAFT_187648 [Serpula lacrymans var. lacrymans S7.3]|uniref:Uncharacterized protein n=1 Tax=Serpula lacrymans var. lacrymans (strain S7.3) TaxID=936435 RepID=F8QA28_SERL3|nr:hypothetical protein SERLA73DRAFT_187648 [Serpula lacrymans var. lacrymans S7.3]